jgi:hypothetical protein
MGDAPNGGGVGGKPTHFRFCLAHLPARTARVVVWGGERAIRLLRRGDGAEVAKERGRALGMGVDAGGRVGESGDAILNSGPK